MNKSSKKLIEIMEMVKSGEASISDAELLFKEWRLQYQGGNSKSFKDHQVNPLNNIFSFVANVHHF